MQKLKYFIITSYIFSSLLGCKTKKEEPVSSSLTVALGSCNKHDENQDYWEFIQEKAPDVFLWLGDNVYADTEDSILMKGIYTQFKKSPAYSEFRDSVSLIYGTWDDHDYGENDAGKEFGPKEMSKSLFMEFFDLTDQKELKTRDGIYQSYVIPYGNKKVKVILLDTRFNRDSLNRDTIKKAYIPGSGTILGENQWKWLKDEFKEENTDGFIICSSIQVVPEEHRFEKWANFPEERTRFLNMVADLDKPFIILSGDRHMTEFSKLNWKNNTIYEFTSSGLNSGWRIHRPESNEHRIGSHFTDPNYGILEIKGDTLTVFSYQSQTDSLLFKHKINWN
jgi:alkaline phosphatase D